MKLIESIESDITRTLTSIYDATGIDIIRIEKSDLRTYHKLYKATIEKNNSNKKR